MRSSSIVMTCSGRGFRACVLSSLLALVWLAPTRSFAQLSEARRTAQRARGLTVAGQCDQAVPVYDRAIQLSPSDPDLLRDRGACHEKLGHRKAAADDYRAYCTMAPAAPDVAALRRRIADLEAPIAQRPSTAAPVTGPVAEPVTPATAPVTVPPGTSPDYVPAPVLPPPPPPVRGAPAEGTTEDHRAPNSVFAEGLGAALLYSINYERLIIDDLAARVGFSYLSFGGSAGGASSSAKFLFFPISVSYIGVHSGKHALELGGGATLIYTSGAAGALGVSSSSSGLVPLGEAMIGYRFHPVNHAGFQLRTGVMLLFGEGVGFSSANPTSIGAIPWPYLSLGASF